MSGTLLLQSGEPMAGGMVFLFNTAKSPLLAPGNYLLSPEIIADINPEGRFSVRLPPGEYHLQAIKRIAGYNAGPPGEGDYFFTSRTAAGGLKVYEVTAGGETDIGVLAEGVPYRKVTVTEDTTGIAGTILNKQDVEIKKLSSETQNLENVILDRDSVINDLFTTFNEVETNLSYIKQKRNQVETPLNYTDHRSTARNSDNRFPHNHKIHLRGRNPRVIATQNNSWPPGNFHIPCIKKDT